MSVDPHVLTAIVGMAMVTYLTRAGGIWLIGRVSLAPRLEAGLRFVPGAVLISIVAPSLLDGGVRSMIAGAVTAALAWRTRSPLMAMIAGVVAIVALRRV